MDITVDASRAAMAERMTRAKQEVPHYYLTMDVDVDAIEGMRGSLNLGRGKDDEITLNALLLMAASRYDVPGSCDAHGPLDRCSPRPTPGFLAPHSGPAPYTHLHPGQCARSQR